CSDALKNLKRVLAAIEDFDRSCLIVGIVSPHPGAGATSIAVNLAKLMTDADERVLLVDCNANDPLRANNVAREPLGSPLRGSDTETALGEATPSREGFCFLSLSSRLASTPTGSARGPTLFSVMHKVLSAERSRYDYVVVDLPSILDHAETGATAKLLDAV